MRGGISHLEFDGKSVGGVEAGKRLLSKAFDRGDGHYQVEVDGGVSHMKIALTDR